MKIMEQSLQNTHGQADLRIAAHFPSRLSPNVMPQIFRPRSRQQYEVYEATRQTNSRDCGVHSLKNFYTLVNGDDPSSLRISGNSKHIRNILIDWFEIKISPPERHQDVPVILSTREVVPVF
nr:hypothetical protein BgiMline_006496 [Biomphalaria glabrata]